ncbi:hypothetical protein GCM10028801_45380 [Nocardioides maradonensis]
MGAVNPLETSFSTGILIPTGTLTVLGLAALFTVVWLWMLVDALMRPASVWRAADRSPVVWALVLILLGWLGGLLYLTLARPSLRRVAAAT